MAKTEMMGSLELPLTEFEDILIRTRDEKLKAPVQPKYHELKDLVRLHCQKLADQLGVTKEMEEGLYMYFFSLLFQDPEGVKAIWKTLYDFDQELKEKDGDETIDLESGITCLLDQQINGVTINWHLAKAMIKGDLEVSKKSIQGEDSYYLTIPSPEDKKARVNNQARKDLIESLREGLGDAIIPKPTPKINVPTDKFGSRERQLFLRIYTFLQKDADLLFYSPQWRESIGKYFEDIQKFLESIIEDLEKMVKNDKRMANYRDFLREVVDTYLIPLRQYCDNLVAYCGANQLPADMLLEPILIKNDLLEEGWKEQDIRSVAAKWKRLKREIKEYVEGNMTMFGIPVVKAPTPPVIVIEQKHEDEQWAPQHTGEVPPEVIDEADKLSALVRDKVRDEMGAADTQPIPIAPKPDLKGLGQTGMVKAIMEDETSRQHRGISLAQTVLDIPAYKEPPKKSFTELVRSKDGKGLKTLLDEADQHEKKELEEILEDQISEGFGSIKRLGTPDLKDKLVYLGLKNDLEELINGFVITPHLRRFFFHELINLFEIISDPDPDIEQGKFSLFSEISRKLEKGLKFPEQLIKGKKQLKKTKKLGLDSFRFPYAGDIVVAVSSLQSFDQNEDLQDYFKRKKLQAEAETVEDHINITLFESLALNLRLISDLHERCKHAVTPAEGFKGYLPELEGNVETAQKTTKQLGKGPIRKLSLGKEGRRNLHEYCKKNGESIQLIWEKLLLPMAASYGKIMFSEQDTKLS